ncbi:hypothetical protein TGRH88_017690 [Toxoplasma gondii]|uniref:Uncharacterized protein n=1 Tax=Toxoplasma gondii TaxID=5811 RepID=A0A7J6KBE4_TOXGO|nr:hypothetical protein TGRH88_017690 [Toxoplasma gondii]
MERLRYVRPTMTGAEKTAAIDRGTVRVQKLRQGGREEGLEKKVLRTRGAEDAALCTKQEKTRGRMGTRLERPMEMHHPRKVSLLPVRNARDTHFRTKRPKTRLTQTRF